MVLDKVGIPLDAVVIEKEGKIDLLVSRSDKFRPVIGGIKIRNPNSGNCTLDFIAIRNGVRGFVTAGHCGEVNDPIYQPKFTGVVHKNYVGYVQSDPNGS